MSGRSVWIRSAVVALARFAVAFVLVAAVSLGYRSAGGAGAWPWWLVVAVAGVVAVALWLARRPVDALADRIVLGRRAGGYELTRDLLARMATTLPVDEVVPRLAEAAGTAVHSPRAEVRVFLEDGGEASQVWPPAAQHDGAPVSVPVRRGADPVGEIRVDVTDGAGSPFATRQLRDLLGPAGLALSTVRLTYALRARLAELDTLNTALRASRDRLVTARTLEQRRLQREVDRKVLPGLRAASQCLADGSGPVALTRAAAAVSATLDAVRTLSRGIYPPRLADAGLAVSLEGWSAHAAVPVPVLVDDPDGVLRGHPEVETALYFCAATVLDALIAGHATGVEAAVVAAGDGVTLRISAQGPGIPDDVALAVRDRVEALDGSALPAPAGEAGLVARIPLLRPGAQAQVPQQRVEPRIAALAGHDRSTGPVS